MTTDSDKESLARRAEQAIEGLTNLRFERARAERTEELSNHGTPLEARSAYSRFCNIRADYYRALDMFGWGHAATRGCLLALVREAWGEPTAYPAAYTVEAAVAEHRGLRPHNAVDSEGGGWHVVGWGVNRGRGSVMEVLNGFSHRSEVEALVAALEAAPR